MQEKDIAGNGNIKKTNESDASVGTLKTILNSINAYLYVSDTETDEILFVNDSIKRLFNIKDNVIGQKCWKIFQKDFEKKCDYCPCYKLDHTPDETIEWEAQNTITERYYRNTSCYIDWYDGRKVHLMHSADITDIKTAQFDIDRRLKQQALMTKISQGFLADSDLNTMITQTLRTIGEFIGLSQALFYKFDYENLCFICENEWMSADNMLQTHIGEKLSMTESFLETLSEFFSNRNFCLSSDDLRAKALIEPYRKNFHNYLIIPIYLKDKLIAFLDFSDKDINKKFNESEINLATFTSNLLSGVFEKFLIEEERIMLSSIVEKSSHIVFNIASDGHIDYANPATQAITGYTAKEIAKGGFELIFGKKNAEDFKNRIIPNTLVSGEEKFEMKFTDAGKKIRSMLCSSFISSDDSSDIACIASDITEMRKLESELIAAKELAEEGNRSKSEFLSRMSHEMRTPMNAIIGMTHIAKSSDDAAKKEYCLEKINNASRHLLGVINDVLDVSKIEAKKFEINNAEFSFGHMLTNVLNIINFRIEEKKQKFTFEIDPSMPKIFVGDEHRLSQVMLNLLSNAVKFTPEYGEVALKADVINVQNDVYTLQIEVKDNGIGMSPEQQRKLFRPFEQADGSIARRFGGTGLGLVITKNIVGQMGGRIWVESALDLGSKFIFTIKMKKGKEDIFRQNVNINELSVLAVDDSKEINDYFKHLMDNMNISCTVVFSGEEALECIQNTPKPFDIIFIDWKMSGLDGIELAKKIREIYGEKPILIMISVSEWSEIEKQATQAGINGFVPKPLFPSSLLNCINKYLNISPPDNDSENSIALPFLEGKTVLLAEDVDINREIILTVLEDTALKIDCAENGRRAVEMFKANPSKYDLILMDIHMPEIDGLEATRQIRNLKTPESGHVPIVAMTADVFQEDVEKCLKAGMDDHLGKPIDFEELFSILKIHLTDKV